MTTKKEPKVAPRTKAVTLAYTLVLNGKDHAPDTTLELPVGTARELVQTGRARWATTKEE